DVAKAAKNKVSVGGRKYAVRRLNERGRATAEIVGIGEPPASDGNDRDLLVPLVTDGVVAREYTGSAGLQRATQRHRDSVKEMPGLSKRLQRGEPVIPTEFVDHL
ncbi:MAG: nicotinate phosphoribosyltransferase, partial [Micrococcaceae bacterium]|nr:nicotinate phosphoribosyltransferase [Micrococcaceae bacterium]